MPALAESPYQDAEDLGLLSSEQVGTLKQLHERFDDLAHLGQNLPKWLDSYIKQVKGDLAIQQKLYTDSIAVLDGDLHIKTRDLSRIQIQVEQCNRLLNGFADHITSLKEEIGLTAGTAEERLRELDAAQHALRLTQDTLLGDVIRTTARLSRLEDAAQRIESRVEELQGSIDNTISAAFAALQDRLTPAWKKFFRRILSR